MYNSIFVNTVRLIKSLSFRSSRWGFLLPFCVRLMLSLIPQSTQAAFVPAHNATFRHHPNTWRLEVLIQEIYHSVGVNIRIALRSQSYSFIKRGLHTKFQKHIGQPLPDRKREERKNAVNSLQRPRAAESLRSDRNLHPLPNQGS